MSHWHRSQATMAKYLDTVRALVGDEEYAATAAKVASFLANEGPQLQVPSLGAFEKYL